MKVSLNWLKKLVNIDGLTPEEIAHRLTFAGVEVESIETLTSGTNLVVGEVVSCEKCPDSDHLHLTKVNCGPKNGLLDIVCGAPNVRVGLKVIVALDGAKLPGGVIHKGSIRGHVSNGMLCSLRELGVEAKNLSEYQINGIEELQVGKTGDENVLELLGLDDVILDLKLLANRSDLYAMNNIAREIETLFERKAVIKTPEHLKGEKCEFAVGSTTNKCSQFSIRLATGIKVGPSPMWLVDVLRASGVRSINNIVDIGNYVMLLSGQPLHMYDVDKLPKKELIVRADIQGDFVALDEKTYHLEKGDICITSDGRVMCLGGVMGALECAVDEKTTNIAIEAANFDFASVRRTSTRLNLTSDSSMRFVKGINPNQYDYVMDLVSELLIQFGGAKSVSDTNTYLAKELKPVAIAFKTEKINSRLGTSFKDEEIVNALTRAFISVEKKAGDEYIATIPAWRIDIAGTADLSEEVIRILGFEHVKSELPASGLTSGKLEENLANKRATSSFLRGIGLDEQLSYSLVNESEVKSFTTLNKAKPYFVMHPLTDEHKYVRTNLLPSLLSILDYNINHGNDDLAYFEVSDIYDEEGKKSHLAIVLSGSDFRHEEMPSEPYGYFHIKGIVEGLLDAFSIDSNRIHFEKCSDENYHPGRSALLKIDGKTIAIFGELHPRTIASRGLEGRNVIVLEMDLALLYAIKTGQLKMSPISRFPAVDRDLALVVSDDVTSDEIRREIIKCDRALIKDVQVFDVYKGGRLEKGTVSLALRITYCSNEKTLTVDDVSAVENNIISALYRKFKAELRK